MKTKILTFADYYLPGYRAGGPIKTLSNMVENMSDEFEFWIVTTDRDFGDKHPYPGVSKNWVKRDAAHVNYVRRSASALSRINRIIQHTDFDVLYLNSFFSRWSTILPLAINRIRFQHKPTVIAPRGEFTCGALSLKPIRKRAFIRLAKFLPLYDGAIWQASSDDEALLIQHTMGVSADRVFVAPNIVSLRHSTKSGVGSEPRDHDFLRLIFLARICPIKNLDFLLRCLSRVEKPISLTICGPLEDASYWTKCVSLINAMPNCISVTYKGEVAPEEVSATIASHDFFVLPSQGENFGQVLFEALASGTPVITSDQTPWRSSGNHALAALPLDENTWTCHISEMTTLSRPELESSRAQTEPYLRSYLRGADSINRNKQLFRTAIALAGTRSSA